MSERHVRLHAFASTKGGVGKSTLAVSAARWIAQKRFPVVVDLDLTGSSLADGLPLEAPDLPLTAHKRFEPMAQSSSWLDVANTRRRRHARGRHVSSGAPYLFLPYSNDALLARDRTNVAGWLWRNPSEPRIRYLPASSLRGDVLKATRVLVEVPGSEWRDALILTLQELAEGDPNITDILLDLPPGTWGFAHAALVAMVALATKDEDTHAEPSKIQWSMNPVLVASPDLNALLPALEYLAANDHHFGATGLLPVVNRAAEAPEAIRRSVPALLSEPWRSLGLESRLVFVSESREMAWTFRGTGGRLQELQKNLPYLAPTLRLV